MTEEGTLPQVDPCQDLRDRRDELGLQIRDLEELLPEALPHERPRIQKQIRDLQAEQRRVKSELDKCEQEAREEPGGNW